MTKNMELCQSRHETPATDGAIFPTEINPLDIAEMECQARNALWDTTELNLYVTGLTVALVAVLNAARDFNIKVILWHYDRDSRTYYPQAIR